MEKINRKPNNQKMENRILNKLDEVVDWINMIIEAIGEEYDSIKGKDEEEK